MAQQSSVHVTDLGIERIGSTGALAMAVCCLVTILALVLGVGLASNLVVRHIVQTLPLWVGVVLGFRHSHIAAWAAVPMFVFWLILMAMIWSDWVGISHLLSGQFSPIEIAMTTIVGAASLAGIAVFARCRYSLSPLIAAALFIVMGGIQLLCFRLSFLPTFAHR